MLSLRKWTLDAHPLGLLERSKWVGRFCGDRKSPSTASKKGDECASQEAGITLGAHAGPAVGLSRQAAGQQKGSPECMGSPGRGELGCSSVSCFHVENGMSLSFFGTERAKSRGCLCCLFSTVFFLFSSVALLWNHCHYFQNFFIIRNRNSDPNNPLPAPRPWKPPPSLLCCLCPGAAGATHLT